MIELTIKVDNIDYDSLAELLFPILMEQVPKDGLAGRLLNQPDKAHGVMKTILGRMSQQQRDELLVKYFQKNRGAAARRLEDVAARNGVNMHISDISAKTL